MRTREFVAVVVISASLAPEGLAQGQPSRVQPVGVAQAIARASGLQADPGGDGLIGFGATYFARFRAGGVHFDVTHGREAPAAFVALSAPTVSRGSTTVPTHPTAAPVAHERRALYGRADGVDERFDVGPDGIELSWQFAERPPGEGDLVVRYAVETSLGEPVAADRGIQFEREHGGVSIGRVTGVDGRGVRIEGTVSWDGTGVLFSLPGEFVDRATYPVVLDPALGPTLPIAAAGRNSVGDAAYDATSDRWLVAWTIDGSGTNPSVLLAQLVSNASGALIGNAMVLAIADGISVPRVANHATRGEYAIAFASDTLSPFSRSVGVARVSAATGSILSPTTVATTTAGGFFADVNIGGRVSPPIGSASGFTIAYRDSGSGMKVQRLTYLPAGTLTVGLVAPLWTNTSTTGFFNLRMSRAAGTDGRLLAVAVRLTTSFGIVATLLDTGSDAPGISGDLVTNTGTASTSIQSVDVDGYEGRWVVAYDSPGSSVLSGPGIRVRPVTVDDATGTFVVGTSSIFGGFATNQAAYPAVAYAAGRVWLAYLSETTFPTTTFRRQVAAIDARSCAICGDSFSVVVPVASPSASLILNRCVATTTSGGAVNGEDALFVWGDPNSSSSSLPTLLAQRLRDYGPFGTTASLGGGCGTTGAVAFNHGPGIGSSGFRCSLNGIPATTLATIFNFSPPTSTIPCGACVWTPFSVTQVPPIVGGTAFVEFPIPCLPTLVGQQFETQWTLIDFSQAPCPVFPGFVLSDRTLLTIGN